MRIDMEQSTRCGFIGHNEIRLNGLRASKCIMADEELGVVEVLRLKWFKVGMDHCPTETLHGQVQILLGDRF